MKRFFVFLTLFFVGIQLSAQTFDANKMRYIEQYKYWAMDEQIRTGVPAAISLAQGILETGAGSSELSEKANNHFGIKCKKEWTGETYLHDDDKRSECFRKYSSAKESYVDHSNFLRERSHYASLFDLEVTDYKGWCTGLRKAGYATNPKYALRLIDLIDEYNLQQYTYEATEIAKENSLVAEVVPVTDKVVEEEVVKVAPKKKFIKKTEPTNSQPTKRKVIYDKLTVKNGRSGFWARKGDYLLPEAVQYNIRYAKLLAINDLNDEPLEAEMFIYLKRKAKKGDRTYHRVKEGETMHGISQNAGVILKYLYSYNNMYEGEEPAAGEKIYLQGRTDVTPKLIGTKSIAKAEVEDKKNMEEAQAKEEAKRAEELEIAKAKIVANEKAEQEAADMEIERKTRAMAAEALKAQRDKDEREAALAAEKQRANDEKLAAEKEVSINVVTEKVTEPNTATKQVVKLKEESPITDLAKAKKIEQLLGDGNSEVEKIYKKNLEVVKEEKIVEEVKIVPAPGQENKEVQKDKDAKTAAKQQNVEDSRKVVSDVKIIPAPGLQNKDVEKEKAAKTATKKKEQRTYENDNVSEDVKDLKKKFDTLIYDED